MSGNLLALAEAAELTGCHPQTLRRAVADGRLAAYRVGPRMIRVKRADLDALAGLHYAGLAASTS